MTPLRSQTTDIRDGLSSLGAFDELARERAARETAEHTAADLARLIAHEHARVSDLERLLAVQTERADRLQRELTQAGFYCQEDVDPPSRWQCLKQAIAGR